MKEEIEKIKKEIKENTIFMVAVKYANLEQIQKLIEYGINDIGFNRLEQLEEILPNLKDKVKIHFIGHLQRNKVKKLLEFKMDLIQSVDSYKLIKKINEVAKEKEIIQNILLEIKTDTTKENGFNFNELKEVFKKIKELKNINIQGLMTIPSKENYLNNFKEMKKNYDLFDNFKYLSMGMSKDYKEAIENGANIIRIGRIIFEKDF